MCVSVKVGVVVSQSNFKIIIIVADTGRKRTLFHCKGANSISYMNTSYDQLKSSKVKAHKHVRLLCYNSLSQKLL